VPAAAAFHQLLHHVALLVALHREHALVAAGIAVLRDGALEGGVQALQPVFEDVVEADQQRQAQITALQLLHQLHQIERAAAVAALGGDGEGKFDAKAVEEAFGELESSIVRNRVISGAPRIDGRDLRTVRPIRIEVGVLPKTHGSAMFTRGETQSLTTVTLGTPLDELLTETAIHPTMPNSFCITTSCLLVPAK